MPHFGGLARNFAHMGLVSAPGYDASAQALFAAMTMPPTATRQRQINDLIVALKSAGVWSQLDFLYVMAAADTQAARLNWISPGTWTLVPAGSPTFAADRGYTGDGSLTSLSMGVALTAMSKLTLNNATVGAWIQQSTTADENAAIFGTTSQISMQMNPRTSNKLAGRCNDASSGSAGESANTVSVGLFAFDRIVDANHNRYINGALLENKATVSSNISAQTFMFLRSATITTRRLSAGFGGASIGTAGQLALYNAVAAYHTAIGA